MDANDIVRRGQRAEIFLKDPLWTEAWETWRLKVFALIESANTDEATLKGKMMLGVANDVRKHFEGLINTGKAAAHEIKLEEERKKKRSWPSVF